MISFEWIPAHCMLIALDHSNPSWRSFPLSLAPSAFLSFSSSSLIDLTKEPCFCSCSYFCPSFSLFWMCMGFWEHVRDHSYRRERKRERGPHVPLIWNISPRGTLTDSICHCKLMSVFSQVCMCACMTMVCVGMNSSSRQVGTACQVPVLCQASPYLWILSIGPTGAQSANLNLSPPFRISSFKREGGKQRVRLFPLKHIQPSCQRSWATNITSSLKIH